MSETPEPPRYCAPGDGVEGGYIIGCDPAMPGFDPNVFARMQQQMTSEMQQLMGIPVEHVNMDQQSMSLKMNEFVAKHKELEAIRDQEVAELDEAVKAAVDAAVDEHGTKALFIHPRIASGSIMGMYFASMAQQALNQELETRRKLLFQKAAETTNEEDENNE